MRILLLSLFSAAAVAVPAQAAPRIVSVTPSGPAVAGQPVELVVEAEGAEGVRLSLPDLQGGLAQTVCRPGLAPRRARFSLVYTPQWAGLHVLELTVVSGACALQPREAGRPVALQVAERVAVAGAGPVAPAAAAPAAACPYAGTRPAYAPVAKLRAAVLCLVNEARAGAGRAPLRRDAALEAVAARHLRAMVRRRTFTHFPRPPWVRAELATMATSELATPRAVVTAWLGSDVHRAQLLDPAARHLGTAVLRGQPVPPERPGATYVAETG